MTNWVLTVGLEVHVELDTKTKMFCGCKNDPFHSEPNANVCPICYGLPGTLPLINKEAVAMTVKLGQALKGTIHPQTFWARKNYFYPDLPKGYQISQSTSPLVEQATLTFDGEDHRIHRIHLEEDAGKLTHGSEGTSLVDFNRAGVPLIEIVTEPDFHTAETAKRFCQELQTLLRHLELSRADMEKGQMRCEANISVARVGEALGQKVEVKNINSFRSVEKAINYEFDRQKALLESGESVAQETRTWSETDQITVSMRTKETSADYRYFPDPDLPMVTIGELEQSAHILPDEQRQKLIELGVAKDTAQILVDRGVAERFIEEGDFAAEMGKIYLSNPEVLDLPRDKFLQVAKLKATHQLTKAQLSGLIAQVKEAPNTLSIDISEIINVTDNLAVQVKEVITANPSALADYQAGKEQAFNFLVGQVMAKTQGKANINQVRQSLQEILKTSE